MLHYVTQVSQLSYFRYAQGAKGIMFKQSRRQVSQIQNANLETNCKIHPNRNYKFEKVESK